MGMIITTITSRQVHIVSEFNFCKNLEKYNIFVSMFIFNMFYFLLYIGKNC